jgi:hypothetical protein
MGKQTLLIAVIALALISSSVAAWQAIGTAGPSLAAPRATQDDHVGTWKAVSGNYGGRAFNFPEDPTTLKHVTASQFTVVTFDKDGKVTRVIGGTYTLKGSAYEELPSYGIGGDFDVVKGKPQAFTLRVEQNRWYQAGTLSNGLAVEEVWERVEKQ